MYRLPVDVSCASVILAFLLFEPESDLIRNERNEFAVRGLALDIAHRIPEVFLQHLNVSPIPGDLYGMPDRALHP